MKKDDVFLYQLNINRKKYPDICEILEEEKDNNGIAFYLRNLIRQDIERRKSSNYTKNEPIQNLNKNTKPIHFEDNHPKDKVESKELEDVGGFV